MTNYILRQVAIAVLFAVASSHTFAKGSTALPDPSDVEGYRSVFQNNGTVRFVDRNGKPLSFNWQFAESFLTVPNKDVSEIQLTIDNAVNENLSRELYDGVKRYNAKGGYGFVLNIQTGEIVGLSSEMRISQSYGNANLVTESVYEIAFIGNVITLAMGLDAGKIKLNSKIDASRPLRHGRYTIDDFFAQDRILSVAEVFYYRSNIGVARISGMFTLKEHKAFWKKMGQLDKLDTPLLTSVAPMTNPNWNRLTSYTVSFGHGIAFTPLQASMALGALMNGGTLLEPTILKTREHSARKTRVVKKETSDAIRYLARVNAEMGYAKVVNVEGYYVGGMAATANKVANGSYSSERMITTFASVFPMDNPEFILMLSLDEPQASEETKGFNTAAWNSGQISQRVIPIIAPLLGLQKRPLPTEDPFPEATKVTGRRASPQ